MEACKAYKRVVTVIDKGHHDKCDIDAQLHNLDAETVAMSARHEALMVAFNELESNLGEIWDQ